MPGKRSKQALIDTAIARGRDLISSTFMPLLSQIKRAQIDYHASAERAIHHMSDVLDDNEKALLGLGVTRGLEEYKRSFTFSSSAFSLNRKYPTTEKETEAKIIALLQKTKFSSYLPGAIEFFRKNPQEIFSKHHNPERAATEVIIKYLLSLPTIKASEVKDFISTYGDPSSNSSFRTKLKDNIQIMMAREDTLSEHQRNQQKIYQIKSTYSGLVETEKRLVSALEHSRRTIEQAINPMLGQYARKWLSEHRPPQSDQMTAYLRIKANQTEEKRVYQAAQQAVQNYSDPIPYSDWNDEQCTTAGIAEADKQYETGVAGGYYHLKYEPETQIKELMERRDEAKRRAEYHLTQLPIAKARLEEAASNLSRLALETELAHQRLSPEEIQYLTLQKEHAEGGDIIPHILAAADEATLASLNREVEMISDNTLAQLQRHLQQLLQDIEHQTASVIRIEGEYSAAPYEKAGLSHVGGAGFSAAGAPSAPPEELTEKMAMYRGAVATAAGIPSAPPEEVAEKMAMYKGAAATAAVVPSAPPEEAYVEEDPVDDRRAAHASALPQASASEHPSTAAPAETKAGNAVDHRAEDPTDTNAASAALEARFRRIIASERVIAEQKEEAPPEPSRREGPLPS